MDKKFLRSLSRTRSCLASIPLTPGHMAFSPVPPAGLLHWLTDVRDQDHRQEAGRGGRDVRDQDHWQKAGWGGRSCFVVPGPGLSGRVVLGVRTGERAWGSFSSSAPCTTTTPPTTGRVCLLLCQIHLGGSLPAPPSALPLPSRVASGDCSEKQVCMPVLPRLSLLNPFITALVQESGLSEVGMNN